MAQNKRLRHGFAATLTLAVLATAAPSVHAAGWVDSWIDQKNVQSPGYFEGQKRGYFTAGSFSARWRTNNDYLMNVTPPKIRAGCGGLDIFMGGFSFLDASYMVEKFQRIMSAAPAAAFDIALKTMSPQVSETIGKLESISSALNQLQLDECKASRAMVATIASPFSQDKSGDLAAIQGDFLTSTGVGNLWTEIQRDSQANNDKGDQAAAEGSMAGCPAEFRQVFSGGSILANAAAQIGMANQDYVNLIRGFVGDIIIDAPATTGGAYKVRLETPCNANEGIDNFLDGNVFAKNMAGNCAVIPDANRNLRQYIDNTMVRIGQSYSDRQALHPEDEAFIDQSPIAIGNVLRTAVATGQQNLIIAQLSDVTAKAYAHGILTNLYERTRSLYGTAIKVMAGQKDASGDNPAHTCRIENVQSALQSVEKMEHRVRDLHADLQTDYVRLLTELNTIAQFVDRNQRFNQQSATELASRFGAAAASRTMSKL